MLLYLITELAVPRKCGVVTSPALGFISDGRSDTGDGAADVRAKFCGFEINSRPPTGPQSLLVRLRINIIRSTKVESNFHTSPEPSLVSRLWLEETPDRQFGSLSLYSGE